VKLSIGGNREFKNPQVVLDKLTQFYDLFNTSAEFIIVSGEADPKREETKDQNVDQIAKQWALRKKQTYSNVDYIPKEPKEKTRDEFFARNKEVIDEGNLFLGFINRGQYHSGTWNAIKHLTEKPYFNSFIIFDEFGQEWKPEDYPIWLKNRLARRKIVRKLDDY
jgi:hypothetical protein